MRAFVRFVLACVLSVLWTSWAVAQSSQDVVWVQIEAHPSLATAQQRAALYADRIEDVNGFALPGGWFGIAVGPYRRSDAQDVLNTYRTQGLIPRDSYIAFSTAYRRQFFPEGANVLNRGVIEAPNRQPAVQTEQAQQTAPAAPAPDETPAQARRSERALSAIERQELQIALKWAGFYSAAIDGSFGRGTRASMAAWQDANGYDVTGILTTQQRIALFQQYNAVLDGLGLKPVQDLQAGIEMQIPTEIVKANGYDYPFAKYTAIGDIPVEVLLISQEGDQSTLIGLYNLMQALEIVPLDGRREQRQNSFLLIGENDKFISHTEAELQNGQIKGFTLIWPAGDEDRRRRLLDEMRGSFARLDGVLDPSWADSDAQSVDLVAGLQIRKPILSRSGFFVNAQGAVVTMLDAVQSCGRVTLDEDTDAQIVSTDTGLGLAVLTPDTAITPRDVAQFAEQQPRLDSEAAVSGFSYEGVLGAPTLTFGSVSDLKGLRGEDTVTRLAVETLTGDAGGPVFDEAGRVFGMVLPKATSGRQLPNDVSFAAKGSAIQSFLNTAGVASNSSASRAPVDPEDITERARDITVLVSCWE